MSEQGRVKPRGNPILHTFRTLEGNAKACLWTEPMFGIPFNLFTPLAAVYMAALGLSPLQIGLVTTVSLISQTVFALLAGVVTDKLGRRRCTLIFDFFAWIIPTMLWATATGPVNFFLAAIFNGCWRVTETSWGLLMTEDAPPEKVIHFFAITNVAGLLAGFLSPLTYLFVREFSLIGTMRVLYFFMTTMMLIKNITLYRMTRETAVGVQRMAQVKGMKVLHRVLDSRHVLKRMFSTRSIVLTVAIFTCYTMIRSVNDNFWPLLITEKLGVPEENLSLLSTLRTLVMLACYFIIVPRLDVRAFKKPLIGAMMLLAAVDLMLFSLNQGYLALIVLGVMLEAVVFATLAPLITTLNMQAMEREERARMLGLATMMALMITAPFGTIAGALSKVDRSLPMLLNIFLALLSSLLAVRLDAEMERRALMD